MASTQIEIALADDDRKRIDRLCRMMAVTSGKPYLAALDSTVEHLLARCTGAIKDAKDYAEIYSKRGDHDIANQYVNRIVCYENVIRWINELEENATKAISHSAALHNEACDSERKQCEHRVVQNLDAGAECIKCSKDLGWYCNVLVCIEPK